MSKETADEASVLNEQDARPAVGIITALPHEYAAVKVLLESQRPIFVPGRGAGRQYLYGEVPAPNGGRHRIVLALLPDTGNDHASAGAALLLTHFPSAHTIIMSGIAGGIPNPNKPAEHVRLGDIVISNREGVVQYDFGKEELVDGKVEFSPRHPPRPPSASLVETARLLQARELEGERPWVRYIERGVERLSAARPLADTDVLLSSADPDEVVTHPNDPRRVKDLPRVFLGPIASSNTLLKNPLKRDQLRDRFGVKAVEMEGSGIADAAWTVEVQYLVVRGVCDYCDRNKGDDWQMYAAVAAAAYTRALLEATPAGPAASYSPAGAGGVRVAGDVNRSVIVSGNNNQITINAAPTDATSPDPPHTAALNVLSSQLESVSLELSDEKLDKLEELRELFREGKSKEAYEGVLQFRRSTNWDSFSVRLRAAVLRALATMTLSLKKADGVVEAAALADEATRTEPGADDATLRARIKVQAEGYEAALEELPDPRTLDGFNLRLGLLIEMGRIEDALETLRRPPQGVSFDAETQRLYALALLASKDVQGARERIGRAMAERPGRIYVRFNAAIIDYLSALSPVVLPPHLIPYPRPTPVTMIKGDAESRERILRAAEEFKQLAELSAPGSGELKNVEAWRVACLSSLPELRSKAGELCKERLADDPGDVRIIPWVLFHNYDVDLSASASALARSLEATDDGGDAGLEKLIALLGIHLRQGTHQEAFDLLDNKRDAFAAADESDLWRYWRAQLLVAAGLAEVALEESSQVKDRSLRRAIKTASLCEIANGTGDWQPLFSYLEKSYDEENEISSLLTLCDIKGQQGDWAYVADRAELYCDAVGTTSAARFVFAAAWYAKRPGQCLHLLNKYEPLFPNRKLPADLRKLRVHCLINNTGDIRGALTEAEGLAQDYPGVESVMLLMDVQLTKGDLAGLEVSARRLLNQDDLTSGQLLRAAHLVQLKNPTLARKFWTRAAEGASDDPGLTAFAVQMAAKLGVENQRGSLMQRMMEYAAQGQGPVQVMNMEQTLEIMREGWERREKLQQMYASGEAPIQMLAKDGLAQVIRGLAGLNRTVADAHLRKRILIRHGGRTLLPADYAEVSKNWRLHCDTTSLLLAHELGVLDKIEKLFKPLRIPRHVTTALIAQRDKLRPHQQSQLDNSRVILDLVSKDKLHVLAEKPSDECLDQVRRLVAEGGGREPAAGEQDVEASGSDVGSVIHADAAKLEQQLGRDRIEMLAAAFSEDSFAVGFRPVTCYGIGRHALLKLPEALDNQVVNGRALADSLRGNERITDEAYREDVRALGVEGKEISPVSPLIGSKLFLMRGVANVLAGANLLERACDGFEVFISPDCVKEAEGTIEFYERQAKIETWLSELIDRISDGLDEGAYEFIGIPDERVAQRDEQEEQLDHEFAATLDLFLFEPRQWDVIWVDDRALNKFPLRTDEKGGVPLVGINEILLALRARGELDDHDYYNLLQHLREGDFRYIPLDEGEILRHLKRARIENGRVVETAALAALRRYYASCLLDKDILQLASPAGAAPNPHSELPFVVQVITAAAGAIAGVWADDRAEVEAAARADWILNNLYTGNYGCSHLRRDDVPRSSVFTPAKIIALDLSNLLMRGVSMHGNPLVHEPVQRRDHYFNWLTERVIASCYGSDPEVIKATAAELQERFGYVKEQEVDSPLNELFIRAFMGKFFLDLPDVISDEMEFDAEMTEWLQLRVGSVITAAGVHFAADEYWRAVGAALEGGSASIKVYDSDGEYRLVPVENVGGEEGGDELLPTVAVIGSDDNKVGEMADPSFGLLLPDVRSRRAALGRLRNWFDCGQEQFEREADELASVEDPVARVARLYEWRARSSEMYYSQLEQKFRDREPVFWSELLPPSAESFAGRLRLPMSVEGRKIINVWGESASTLLKEEDLLAAVVRLASVPVAMPEEAVAAVASLPEGERLELFERLASAWTSPLRRLHLVNLILRSSPASDAALETARAVLKKLYDGEASAEEFRAFHELLTFVNDEVGAWAESRSWSAGVRLAVTWAHASRLHGMFRGIGYTAGRIVSMVEAAGRSSFRESLVRDPGTWTDCAHPGRLNRAKFLTHGVASMLSGIDQAVLEAAGVPALVREEVFREVGEGIRFPEFSLLNDAALCRDSLGAVLGGDRYSLLSGLIGPEGLEVLSSERLKQGVKGYLEELVADPSRVANWTWIQMITGDLPVYPEFGEMCRSVLEAFDPLAARKDGFRPAWFAFRAAANQVANMGDESLRQKYRDYLVGMLKNEVTIGKEDTPDAEFNSLERRAGALMEVALVLSHVSNDHVASNAAFSSLLEVMAGGWPDLSRHYRHTLSREVWNLPIEESEGWWHLTLSMRTSN